nr:transposase [Mucilaginibacter psychrotolerans]
MYNWLKLIDEKYEIKTFAFVIMPNHVHAILYLPDNKADLNKIIGNGKRFMAYALVDRLEQRKEEKLLNILSMACSEPEKSKGQKHKAFETSFDAKPIFTLPFLHQKLDYIHHNPVSGKWNLCKEYTDYPHSSAAFYVDGIIHEHVLITDYRDYWL